MTPIPARPRRADVVLVALFVAACGSADASPRPGAASPELFTDPPLETPFAPPTLRPPTAPPAATPVGGDWPDGWADDFCAAWEQVVIAQELAVDIGRALDEEARDDALALAVELEGTAEGAVELLAPLADWPPAAAAVTRLGELLDLGQRVGRNYRRFLDEGREPALERAQTLAAEMRPLVDGVVAEVGDLADEQGLGCPGLELRLEAP